MSDLISRRRAISILEQLDEHSLSGKMDISNAIYLLESQPTAYDIGKVVDELEEATQYIKIDGKHTSVKAIHPAQAIEIVKQGGATKNCNNCANYTEPDEVDNGCYLCCKGYEDNYEPKVDNDVCEWTLTDTRKVMPYKTSCGNEDLYDNSWKYCPHCSKKIKSEI